MSADAYQLTKAQISDQRDLMKTEACSRYLAKKQMERGGVDEGFYKTQGRSNNGKPPGTVMKADGSIRTIQDMIDYWYGFVPEYYAKQSGGVSKADDPVLGGGVNTNSPTAGYRNAVYGSEVFSNINHEATVFSLLENRAWTKSGERTVTDFGHTLGSGGLGENAEIPDTNAPDIQQYEQTAKTVSHSFDVSQVKQLIADTQDDDLDDPFDWLRRYYGTGTEHMTGMGEHPKHINVQLMQNIEDFDPSTDTENMLSLDRIISDQEEADIGTVDDAASEIYDFDRDSGEFESNVIGNAGTTRTFTIDLLDDAIRAVKSNSGANPVQDDNYFFLTNHDTYQRIEEEVGGKERLEAQRASVGLNGVETNPGDDVGITVNSYKQIPIFESVDVPQDPGGIGRVYLVDSSTMFIKTLLPTQFYSSGTEVNDDPYAIDRLGNQGLYVTIGETVTVAPSKHAKVRDLE